MFEYSNSLLPKPGDLRSAKRLIDKIRQIVDIVHPGAACQPFGSFVNGLWMKNSDIDLCVIPNRVKPGGREDRLSRRELSPSSDGDQSFSASDAASVPARTGQEYSHSLQIKGLRAIGAELKFSKEFRVHYRFLAKVPILHVIPRVSDDLLDPSGETNDLKGSTDEVGSEVPSTSQASPIGSVDICLGNELGVENSKLIAAYFQLNRGVKTLGLIIKQWAKSRDINDRSTGTLSSFSLLLMLIHYLQSHSNKRVFFLPHLQPHDPRPLAASGIHLYNKHVAGVDILYVSNKDSIQRLLGDEGSVVFEDTSPDSLGSLLHGFFQYYGHRYTRGVVSIRGGDNRVRGESSTNAYPYSNSSNQHSVSLSMSEFMENQNLERNDRFLFVENPFEPEKDVLTLPGGRVQLIRSEFRRAARILEPGGLGVLEELLKPSKLKLKRPETFH